jgi:hypothetical protein
MVTFSRFSAKRTIFFIIKQDYSFSRVIFGAGNSFAVAAAKLTNARSLARPAIAFCVANRTRFGVKPRRSFVYLWITSGQNSAANQKDKKHFFHKFYAPPKNSVEKIILCNASCVYNL